MGYKLSDARSYWSLLSSELVGLSNSELRKIIEAKIEKRNKDQGAMKYRLKTAELIRKMNVKSLLDFGCGVGGDSVWFSRELGVKVTFADISRSNIELVSRYQEIWEMSAETVFIHNPETVKFPKSYDMIFSNGVLHHIPQVGKVVENLKRFLKPNGLFVCMLYTFKHYLGSKGDLGYAARSEADPRNPYSRFYTEQQARQLFNGYCLVDSWKTYNDKFGWYVFRREMDSK